MFEKDKEKKCECCGSTRIELRGTKLWDKDNTYSCNLRDLCIDCLENGCKCKGEKVKNKEIVKKDKEKIKSQVVKKETLN